MEEAELAIVKPARNIGADYAAQASEEIVRQTRNYPYFLQEWGSTRRILQKKSPITLKDVGAASTDAIAALVGASSESASIA